MSILADVATAQRTALRPEDLTSLREDFGERVSSNIKRLSALERSTGATARVIAEAASSVVFLQGAYGLRSTYDGRMLRHVLGANGRPLASRTGGPRLSLDGEGAVAEVQFTGTGFLLENEPVVVTNRHVAVPWEDKPVGQDIEPVMIRLIGWLPGEKRAFDVALLAASDDADLALVSLADAPVDRPGLALAAVPPPAGSEVVVMGYPTGLRAMLAKSGTEFVKALQKDKDVGFWSVAERLANAGLIAPLASSGIVGQVAAEALVYDAETTHGGSGGPVLNGEGEVVAVNAAILPEYGGSNIGVPVAKLKELLAGR
jgi:serine protease Do